MGTMFTTSTMRNTLSLVLVVTLVVVSQAMRRPSDASSMSSMSSLRNELSPSEWSKFHQVHLIMNKDSNASIATLSTNWDTNWDAQSDSGSQPKKQGFFKWLFSCFFK